MQITQIFDENLCSTFAKRISEELTKRTYDLLVLPNQKDASGYTFKRMENSMDAEKVQEPSCNITLKKTIKLN